MRADPEPNDLVPCPHGERPIGEADACREDGSGRMNLLESEAGMGGVAAEQVVGKTGLGLNLRRQGSEGLAKPLRRMRGQSLSGSSGRVRPARCSCNASSARVSSAPGCFANEASQSPSAFTSSRMAAAKASWSAGGSLDAASKAFFSLLVMVPIYGRSVRRANCTTPPNGSRLSCGRLARRRKGVGRSPCPARGTTLRFL